MKKLFFTGLVTVVAIGGAFAGNGKTTTLVLAGILNSTECNISVDCSLEYPIPCRLDQSDTSSPQLYLIDNQQPLGKCTVFLGYD